MKNFLRSMVLIGGILCLFRQMGAINMDCPKGTSFTDCGLMMPGTMSTTKALIDLYEQDCGIQGLTPWNYGDENLYKGVRIGSTNQMIMLAESGNNIVIVAGPLE